LNNVKFVTRRAKLRMMNTIASLGTTATDHQAFITDLRWMEKIRLLKTTKFIESKPICSVKKGNIPPF